MNMIEAAKETLALARSVGMDNCESDKAELDYPHLESMLVKMSTEEMSEGKMGRWLGWMQAAVVCNCGELTLEHMKEINRKYAD